MKNAKKTRVGHNTIQVTYKMSLTDELKKNLQLILADYGIKASKQTAWNIFKDIINKLVDISIKHGKLSLAGIGVFRLLKSKPRAGKVDVYKFVPRFRFSPSTRINKYLEDNIDCFKPGKRAKDVIKGPAIGAAAKNTIAQP